MLSNTDLTGGLWSFLVYLFGNRLVFRSCYASLCAVCWGESERDSQRKGIPQNYSPSPPRRLSLLCDEISSSN